MKFAKTFTEWMDEETLDLENVSLSLRGDTLSVKNESGTFDIQLAEDQVAEVTEKMRDMADGTSMSQDADQTPVNGAEEDEEDQIAPSSGGVGRLSGM